MNCKKCGTAIAAEVDLLEGLVRREIMVWVADRLRTLEKLPPHDWDRSTLRDLAENLSDEHPRLRGLRDGYLETGGASLDGT